MSSATGSNPTFDIGSIARREVIAVTAKVAMRDSEYRKWVTLGDEHRDARQWAEAVRSYSRALELYPYHAESWVQLGHAHRECGEFGAAEVAYRTACAYGVERAEVITNLAKVLQKQNISQNMYPVRFWKDGYTTVQVPGKPDIDTLSFLMFQVYTISEREMLHYLRICPTLDNACAEMIGTLKFEQNNIEWLLHFREGDMQ